MTDTEIPRLLSFLFLAFSTVTDGELVAEELQAIATRLKPWIPASAETQLVEFIEQAAALYDAHESEASVWSSASDFASLLTVHLSAEQRLRVIDDLVYIAKSDEVVVPGEVRFVARVLEVFGLDLPNPLPRVTPPRPAARPRQNENSSP